MYLISDSVHAIYFILQNDYNIVMMGLELTTNKQTNNKVKTNCILYRNKVFLDLYDFWLFHVIHSIL